MYEPAFGLHEPAFSLTPDPRFLWPSETHQEGLLAIQYAITRRKGFMLLTGEVGTGKTTLLRAAIGAISQDLLDVPETAIVAHTADLSSLDLMKFIASEFRIRQIGSSPRQPRTKADYVIALQEFLVDRLRGGLNTVLIIDEAQNLDLMTLEQVRLLSNLETDSYKLLQIVLTGQPELLRKLADPRLRQLRQRIAVEHHIAPLRAGEVLAYLRHRIEVAGGRYGHVFAEGCENAFVEYSKGSPRRLNLLADRSLLAAYSAGMRPVPPSLVEQKAVEMLSAERQPAPAAAPSAMVA